LESFLILEYLRSREAKILHPLKLPNFTPQFNLIFVINNLTRLFRIPQKEFLNLPLGVNLALIGELGLIGEHHHRSQIGP
jgi:hypothetical protein